MPSVGIALLRAARMRVDIGDDSHAQALADLPERSKEASVKSYDTRVETMRVEVVIGHEADYPSAATNAVPQKKCPTFPRSPTSALSETGQQSEPNPPGTGEFMPRRPQLANSHSN